MLPPSLRRVRASVSTASGISVSDFISQLAKAKVNDIASNPVSFNKYFFIVLIFYMPVQELQTVFLILFVIKISSGIYNLLVRNRIVLVARFDIGLDLCPSGVREN